MLMKGGSVACWGQNDSGELGDGSTFSSSTPVAVQGLTGVTAIVGGWGHSCALKDDATVVCWGKNTSGQLGDASKTNASMPVGVKGLSSVKAITAGNDHTCALKVDGGKDRTGGRQGTGQGPGHCRRRLAHLRGQG